MEFKVYFDIKNNIENIYEKNFFLGENFVNFISLNMENVLNSEIISNLSKSNCKEVINKLTVATSEIVIPEIIATNVLIDLSDENIDIQQIKSELTKLLNVYNKFKHLVEFCYFNDNSEITTPLQKFIDYLHKFNIEEVKMPQEIFSSFGLKPKNTSSKLFKNKDVSIMLQKNTPFFYYGYDCLTFDDYMIACFKELIENNYLILKCENCGKYFIAYNKKNTLYCNRTSPQDTSKKCREYGKEIKWLERTKDENDWYSLYRKIYQTFQKRAIRNPNNKESKQAFDSFKKATNRWKKAVKAGAKTEAEFMSWLQEFRKNK